MRHISTWCLAVTSILFGAHREAHPRGQMVTIFAFQAKDPGSIPGGDNIFFSGRISSFSPGSSNQDKLLGLPSS